MEDCEEAALHEALTGPRSADFFLSGPQEEAFDEVDGLPRHTFFELGPKELDSADLMDSLVLAEGSDILAYLLQDVRKAAQSSVSTNLSEKTFFCNRCGHKGTFCDTRFTLENVEEWQAVPSTISKLDGVASVAEMLTQKDKVRFLNRCIFILHS